MIAAILLMASPQPAALRITATKSVFSTGEIPIFRIELQNASEKPIRILDFTDGNREHWLNPHVGWSVLPVATRGSHPRETPSLLLSRCGNMASPSAALFETLPPGESGKATWEDGPLDFPTRPGSYRAVFYYEVVANDRPRVDVGFGGLGKPLLELYGKLTPMKLRSNEVRFEVAASGG